MLTIGLLGTEYDGSVQYLKRQVEDRGHKTITINLTHLPRVVHSTVSPHAVVHDGHNLFDFDCFYLIDMGLREPFFHVTYDRELWSMLRERYHAFAACEVNSVHYTVALIKVIAAVKPMINSPQVYMNRLHLPYQLHHLNAKSYSVPEFAVGSKQPDGITESSPLKLDEYKTWEVLSFPKSNHTNVRIWQDKPNGVTFKIIVIGDSALDEALRYTKPSHPPEKIKTSEVPSDVIATALSAARDLSVKFGEVICTWSDNKVWITQIDPSPDLRSLKELFGLRVSSALADYLINTVCNA